MKLEEIFEEWDEDSIINRAELGDAALAIPKLHHKYFRMLSNERLRLRKMESEHDKLINNKRNWLLGELSKEELSELGWAPCLKRHLKSEIEDVLLGDEETIKSKLGLSYQREKVEVLSEIIKIINNRSFQISNAINWEKFKAGM